MKISKFNIYFITVIIITTILCILQNSSVLLSITSITGVIYSLLVTKNTKYAFIFGIINVANYGYILFTENIYGGLIYNVLYSLPMLIWGYINWCKKSKLKNSGIKKMNKKTKIISFILVLIVICACSYTLNMLSSNNYILDSISTILGYVGIYLMTNKYIEQWNVWVICNLVNLILWISLTINDLSNIPVVIMWFIYFINSLYGYITWNKKY